MATDEPQSLSASGAPVRRARRPLLLAATGLLLVIGLVLADLWQAHREMNHLLAAVTVSSMATASAFQSVNPWMKQYNSYQAQSDRDRVAGEIQSECVAADANVQDKGALVSEVSILPWHRSLAAAQDAYSAFNKAWQHMLTACADDGTRWGEGSNAAQIQASLRTAHRAFTNALPPGDESDRSRIEAIFKD